MSWITELALHLIIAIQALTLGVALSGCNLVTVEIHQSAILDKGDDTADKYSNKSQEGKTDSTNLRVPIELD